MIVARMMVAVVYEGKILNRKSDKDKKIHLEPMRKVIRKLRENDIFQYIRTYTKSLEKLLKDEQPRITELNTYIAHNYYRTANICPTPFPVHQRDCSVR
jgi:hypothetical protein